MLFWVVLGLFWVVLGYFELFWIFLGKVLIFLEKKIFTVYFVRWYVVLRNRKYVVLGCFGLFWVISRTAPPTYKHKYINTIF